MLNSLKLLVIMILFLSCRKIKEPVLTHIPIANSISHNIQIQSYEIPKGIFRGVLWPSKEKKVFQIWLIVNHKEQFFDILPPEDFIDYEKQVTEDWTIKEKEKTNDKIVYLANKKDSSKSIELELPTKKRKYSFYILRNISGQELLIFMDISETIIDKGLFGFVLIRDK